MLSASGFDVAGKQVSWSVENGTSSALTIVQVQLDWPAANGELKKIRLDDGLIWNAGDDGPPSDIHSNWKGTPQLSPGVQPLSFEFSSDAGSAGYALGVELAGGCQLSAGD